MKSLLITAALIFSASFSVLKAQEPSLKPTMSAPRAERPTLLSLEIEYNTAIPPAYIGVRGAEEKPRWIWVTRFARVPNWQLPAGELPIQAVRVETQFNGETADVRVSLLRGVKLFDREDTVATYHIGLNQPAFIPELKSFGVEPFKITLKDVATFSPAAPNLENRTSSIQIVSVDSENVPLPIYKLTLRNMSEKKVRGLRIEVISDGRPGLSAFRQGEHDRALIQSGGTIDVRLPVVRAQQTGTGYTPGSPAANLIVLRTLVFDDLTFEGDQDSACMYESFVVGRRLWLRRVLPFIEQQLAEESITPQEFKDRFLELTYALRENERTGKSAVSATCADPDLQVDIATQGLKLELIRELDQIIKTRPAPPINFRAWLESTRAEYKAWLARL
jgi:hypothetical protein